MHILAPLSTAFLAATAFALPNELATRDRISITLYEDHNFSGNSGTFTLETQSECLGLSNRGWSNRVSSIRVPSGYRCRLWDSNSCDSKSSPDIYAPGASELGSMNDKATSFKCYKN